MKAERILVVLLRLMALAEISALIGVVMPAAWMAVGHEWLGLGTFPDAPITPYLARCLSAFYMMHGILLWICSCNIRRYAPIITYVAVTGIAFSVLVTLLDIRAGFPWHWTVGEGPTLTALSIAFLVLLRKVAKEG
jgi:hypothetical protein